MFLKSLQKKNKKYSSSLGILFLVVFFILYRLPLLGFDIINVDAPRWKTRVYQFSTGVFTGNFSETAVIYHPGVTLMWVGTFAVKFYNLASEVIIGYVDTAEPLNYMWLNFTQKFFLILFLSFFLYFILSIIQKIKGWSFVLIFFSVLTFEPIFLAYTRVFHTDALVTILLFTSVIAIFYSNYLKTSSVKIRTFFGLNIYDVLSGIAAGLAILTKSNALFIIPFLGLELLVLTFFHQKSLTTSRALVVKFLRNYFLVLVILLLTFFVFWPALWVSLKDTLSMYYYGVIGIGVEGGHPHKWFGFYTEDPGVFFYPIIIFLRFSPWFLLSALSGVLLFIYNSLKKKKISEEDLLYFISFLFIIFYLIFMTIPTKKIDRYVLPTVPFFAIFSTYYIYSFASLFKKQNKLYVLLTILAISFFSFFSTFRIFPNYIYYYSPLVGGHGVATQILDQSWPAGQRELYRYINSLPSARDRKVFIYRPFIYDPLLSNKVYARNDLYLAEKGDLFILQDVSDFKYINLRPFVLKKIVKVGSSDIYWVYEFTD